MMTKRLRVLAVTADARDAGRCLFVGRVRTTAPHPIPARLPASRPARSGSSRTATGSTPRTWTTFYEQYPDIDLETASFGSNDEAVAKLQAGFQADVINSCVDEATLEMVNKGLYAPLDVSRLENWDDIWPSMKALPGVQVDGEVYLVPADAGTAGILYNADVVTTPPTSWLDLFDPQWAGRASIEDLSVTAIDIGALVNGISDPLAMSPDQLELVKNYLIDHRDQFRTFWKGAADIKSQFKSGEVVISSGYPDYAKQLRREGVNAQFAVAKEGQMLWTCGYGISPDAENLDAAYALLNWYSSVPPQVYAATEFDYITSNMTVGDLLTPEAIANSGLDTFGEAEQRDPGESAERSRGMGRGVDRGESFLVAQVAHPVRLDATGSLAPSSIRFRRAVNRWGWRGFLAIVFLALFGPLAILVAFSFNDSNILAFPFDGLTTKWYSLALQDPSLREALLNSTAVAFIVAPLCLVLGTLAAFGLTRFRFRGRGAIGGLVGAPLVLPWLIVGIAALMGYAKANVDLSLKTVIATQTICTFPLVTAIVSAQLFRFQRVQEEAAIDLGCSRLEVLRHIILPHIAPALAAAGIFAFTWSFNNYEISAFTIGFQQTFPIWVYSSVRNPDHTAIVNAISTLISAVQVVLIYLALRMLRSRGGASAIAMTEMPLPVRDGA